MTTCLLRFLLGRGPLKRGSDRLEALGRVLAAAVVLAAVPVALAVGTVARTHLVEEAAARAAALHETTAVTRAAAPYSDGGSYGTRVAVEAVFTDPDGLRHAGEVLVAEGTPAGSAVTVWLADDGTVATAPMSGRAATTEAVTEGLVVLLGTTLVAVGGQALLRRRLDRARHRRWADEWAVVEPRWSLR